MVRLGVRGILLARLGIRFHSGCVALRLGGGNLGDRGSAPMVEGKSLPLTVRLKVGRVARPARYRLVALVAPRMSGQGPVCGKLSRAGAPPHNLPGHVSALSTEQKARSAYPSFVCEVPLPLGRLKLYY
jgi:hypothetical protein